MNFFSDERAAELRELFFESAQELLQALNEQGLDLEKRPGDAEVVRSIRRTVHTLKGDSAACGFRELKRTHARVGRGPKARTSNYRRWCTGRISFECGGHVRCDAGGISRQHAAAKSGSVAGDDRSSVEESRRANG